VVITGAVRVVQEVGAFRSASVASMAVFVLPLGG
jgi:hypothetical protein